MQSVTRQFAFMLLFFEEDAPVTRHVCGSPAPAPRIHATICVETNEDTTFIAH